MAPTIKVLFRYPREDLWFDKSTYESTGSIVRWYELVVVGVPQRMRHPLQPLPIDGRPSIHRFADSLSHESINEAVR